MAETFTAAADRGRLAPLEESLCHCRQVLILLCGNPSRGDDGLGYACYQALLESLEALIENGKVRLIYDTQWQIEDALEFTPQRLLLFIDAAMAAETPFQLSPVVHPQRPSFSSHSLSPAQLLAVSAQLGNAPPAAIWQLLVPGNDFSLGSPLSRPVQRRSEQLLGALVPLIKRWGETRR